MAATLTTMVVRMTAVIMVMVVNVMVIILMPVRLVMVMKVVMSSQPRDQTPISCIGRPILYQ